MNSTLTISLFQIPLVWCDPATNRNYIETKITALDNTDLIVLPETFSTGFTVEYITPETMDGVTVNWMIATSKKYGKGILGSLLISENTNVYNRMLLVSPDGHIQCYDKWHLFGMGNENKLLTKGNDLPIFHYNNWKIKPLICYDLRFPVTSRNTKDYDIIICIANWPKPRIDAWDTLLKARAIENLSYVVGVNRVGMDNMNLEYVGHSNIYDPLGKQLLETSEIEATPTFTLLKSEIENTRKYFPFLEDQDRFIIRS